MCRKLWFISAVIVAATSVTFAQYMPGMQCSGIIGFGGTYSAQAGSVGLSTDTNFDTTMDSQVSNGCNGTQMSTTNSGFIDQGTAAGGVGGYRSAGQMMGGSGFQIQTTGTVPAKNGVTCFPINTQSQMLGGTAGQSVLNTCGTGFAVAVQDGAISEAQGANTPSTSGNQYQTMVGSQGAVAYGVPTSFSTASGTIGGGAAQCQTFGGISIQP